MKRGLSFIFGLVFCGWPWAGDFEQIKKGSAWKIPFAGWVRTGLCRVAPALRTSMRRMTPPPSSSSPMCGHPKL